MADTVSILTGGSNNFETTAEHLNYGATDFISDGVVGAIANTSGVAPATGGLACNAQGTPNMTVAVTAGVAYVTATPTGQASQRLRAAIAAQNVTISSNSTGGTRYDWIYVVINATNANNPNVSGSNVASLVASRSTSSSSDNGTPPTYGYHIATVTVANGASSITNGNIADTRTQAGATVTNVSYATTSTLSNPYKFFAYHNTTQSIATDTKISFNTERFDTNNNFSSSRYTAPVSGFYYIGGSSYIMSAGNYSVIYAKLNGTTSVGGGAGGYAGGQDINHLESILLQLSAGDYIELFHSHGGGGSITLYGDSTGAVTNFWGFLVSRT